MWETILKFFAENYPTLLWVVVTVVLTWQIFKLYNRFKKVEQVSNNVPCEVHKENIKTIQGNMPILQDIKDSVRKIEEYIIKKDPKSIGDLLRKCSPYMITNYGNSLLDDSGARKCIDDNVLFFIESIEELKPLVALDVEQYSLTVLNDNLKHDIFNEIKNFIYNAPDPLVLTDKETGSKIETSINLESILMVMSIYLRDKYFEKHPEIDIKEFFVKIEKPS